MRIILSCLARVSCLVLVRVTYHAFTVPVARPRSPPTRQAPVMTHRPRCRMPTNPLDPGRLALLNTTSVPYPAVDLKHVTAPPAGEEGEAAVEQGLGALREPAGVTRVSVGALRFGGCCLDAVVRNLRGQTKGLPDRLHR
jgi:hypothetical protein